MKLEELLDMKVKDLLYNYCVLYSAECGYTYGVSTWEESNRMFEIYDLEDEYCFSQDPIFPQLWEVDGDDEVIDEEGCIRILDYLGVKKRNDDGENEIV